MQVFEIGPDFDYQSLNVPANDEDFAPDTPMSRVLQFCEQNVGWIPAESYVHNPLLLEGSFLWIINRLVSKPELRGTRIHELMRDSGELIPFRVSGVDGYELWVPNLELDVVDLKKGKKPGLLSYDGVVIKEDLLPKPTLFRFAGRRAKQYVSTGYGGDSSEDFYHLYHEMGLSGISFKLVWES